jgi:urease beta subunit
VKINKERKPYNVAEVADRGEGERIIIVGNHFHWDMGSLVAYTEFEPYDA